VLSVAREPFAPCSAGLRVSWAKLLGAAFAFFVVGSSLLVIFVYFRFGLAKSAGFLMDLVFLVFILRVLLYRVMFRSFSTLGSMRYDGNTVVGEPRESLGVDKVDNSFFFSLFLSSRCYVPDNSVSQGDPQRILGLKEWTATKPGRQDQAMPRLIPQSGPVIRTLARSGECFSEAGQQIIRSKQWDHLFLRGGGKKSEAR
jgi:hypothetical protein